MQIKIIKNLLSEIINSDLNELKISKIQAFQEMMFLQDTPLNNDKLEEELVNLAYDLEYYEPNIDNREEGISYLGNDELNQKISRIIDDLDAWDSSNNQHFSLF